MGGNTTIEWCNHTFNPWRGCTKVAAGCTNCYADTQSRRNPKVLGIWGPDGTRVVASEQMWREPKKWERSAEAKQAWHSAYRTTDSVRPRVFCASLCDVFEDWTGNIVNSQSVRLWVERDGDGDYIPEKPQWAFGGCRPLRMSDVRLRLFRLIDETPNLDWLLLTKRPENIRRMWPVDSRDTSGSESRSYAGRSWSVGRHGRPNIWLGTSVACQEDLDRNWPLLAECRDLAPVLFLSIEPLIGAVDMRWLRTADETPRNKMKPDWVIVGGESGSQSRPCNVEWIRSVVGQCREAGVPVFVKQLGSLCIDGGESDWPAHTQRIAVDEGVKVRLVDAKGCDPEEWPLDLRVREFPKPMVFHDATNKLHE